MFQFLKKLMATPLTPAEVLIAQTLQAGHLLTVRWECGGDEGFVYTEIDGQEIEAGYNNEKDLAYLLEQYLTERLNLPSAGEFSMEGTGRIFQEGPDVIIDYQSQAFTDESWMEDMSDEELAEIGYTRPEPSSSDDDATSYPPDEGMSDEYTGRQVLFHLPQSVGN